MADFAVVRDEPTSTRLSEAMRRAKSDFVEMPGMQLTYAQARRLWALDAYTCESVLSMLVQDRFLVMTRRDTFARPSLESINPGWDWE
jgi:hypothetical protein